MMDIFGNTDPHKMPGYFFTGSLHKDYHSAIRADVSKQRYTVCPRHWYISASFRCDDCDQSFVWSAGEQKLWFEEYGHYVDSQPKQCKTCRQRRRKHKDLKKEYDQILATALDSSLGEHSVDAKIRVIGIVDTMETGGSEPPARMLDLRRIFYQQVYKK